MDYLAKEIDSLVQWLREQRDKAGRSGLLVGVSGGIDSAVTAALIRQAAGENALGLILPCHSPPQDLEDARLVCRTVGLAHLQFDLSAVHQELLTGIMEQLSAQAGRPVDDQYYRIADANLRARLRMCTLYAVANARDCLVVGTDNAAEVYTGYFTKYGDGGVDLLPLSQFTKREVRALGRLLSLPEKIIQRTPTAGLWSGQTDEAEMGVTYDQIDDFLEGKAIDQRAQQRIEQLHRATEHKRCPPLTYQRRHYQN